MVSHDRDFLQGRTNKVYEFKDGNIKEYLGDINFYLEQRQAEDFRKIERKDAPHTKTESRRKENDYQQQKRLKSLKNKLSGVEKKIAALEKEIAEIDHELLMNYDATIAKEGFFDAYEGKKKLLEGLMGDWEALSEEMEAIS